MTPMRFYKFLNSEHLDIVLGGNIRISRDSVFREIERQWIGDRLENVSEAVFGRNGAQLYGAETVNAMAPPGRAPLVAVAPGVSVTMHNVGVGYVGAPFYLFSCSHGKISRLVKNMCDDAPVGQRRDACVEICSLPKFAKILFDFGRVRVNGVQRRMTELFSSCDWHCLDYRAMSVDPGSEMVEPSPFKKDIFFRGQSEVRVAFRLRGNVDSPTLDVQIDRPARFLREVFRNRPIVA